MGISEYTFRLRRASDGQSFGTLEALANDGDDLGAELQAVHRARQAYPDDAPFDVELLKVEHLPDWK